jgi:hypothetical protein
VTTASLTDQVHGDTKIARNEIFVVKVAVLLGITDENITTC